MGDTHRRIADAIEKLNDNLLSGTTIPIGWDGAVIAHLQKHYCEKYGLLHQDALGNTVEMSSATGLSDIDKFYRILSSSADRVYTLDMRTKSGGLVRTEREYFEKWKEKTGSDKTLETVVLFDENGYSDIPIVRKPLLDDDRIKWFSTYGPIRDLFFESGNVFRNEYKLTHSMIAVHKDVEEIKKYL